MTTGGIMDSSERQLINGVMDGAGIADADEARQVIFSTLTALGERMEDLHAQALAPRLPLAFRTALCWRAGCGATEATLQASVARRCRIPEAQAFEHVQVICEQLGRFFDEDARKLLALDFPAEVLGWFDQRAEPITASPPPGTAPSSGTTLANGIPGTPTPLSEARPR